jgi:hypothetical protein
MPHFDHTFRAERDLDTALRRLGRERHEDFVALRKGLQDLRSVHHLPEMRRGDLHSDGSNCLTSYMKYMPTVRFAPASKVANTPG